MTAGAELEATLRRYETERLERALLLSSISNLSQTLGQLRPRGLVQGRNTALGLIQHSLKSRCFDGLMAASLAGGMGTAVRGAVRGFGLREEGYHYRVPDL